MLKKNTNGLTLIEVLVAIAIIATLTISLYVSGSYAQKQAKIKLTESTLTMLSTAIEQYYDFYTKFPFNAGASYNKSDLESAPEPNSLGAGLVRAFVNNVNQDGPGLHKNEYSSCEALCYFLYKAPPAKKILEYINPSLLTNKSENKIQEFRFVYSDTTVPTYPLVRVVDPWGTAFRYTCAPGDNFPVITSAGPDKDFGDTTPAKQEDNITSK